MIKEELLSLNSRLENDINTYKMILSETIKNHLVTCIQQYEEDIANAMRDLAKNGDKVLTLRFIPSHIYRAPFTRSSYNQAAFSLEYCIQDYIYEDKLLGFYRKQVRFTDVPFKKFYRLLEDRVNINDLRPLDDIFKNNPAIEEKLKDYFTKLGLTYNVTKHPYFYSIELSF